MRDVCRTVRGGEPLNLLEFDPLHQGRTCRAEFGVVSEMVNERVGVNKDRLTPLQIGEVMATP